MIVLDTNIISEAMAASPSISVLNWLNLQEPSTLYLTTITLAEIGYGLEILPDGKRKRTLQERFDLFVAMGFAQRILIFDETAARTYGHLMALRKSMGRPLSSLDGQIAAIAFAHRFAIATRNVSDFDEMGISLINPWHTP